MNLRRHHAAGSRQAHETGSGDARRLVLTLTFDELALIYTCLEAVKTLRALPPQDELLNDTIELVDQALSDAIP